MFFGGCAAFLFYYVRIIPCYKMAVEGLDRGPKRLSSSFVKTKKVIFINKQITIHIEIGAEDMIHISGTPCNPIINEEGKLVPGKLIWSTFSDLGPDKEDGVKLGINYTSGDIQQIYEAIEQAEQILTERRIDWVLQKEEEWVLDLDKIRNKFEIPELAEYDWFTGKVKIKPRLKIREEEVFGERRYNNFISVLITQETILRRPTMSLELPVEIKKSLEKFHEDYPDSGKVGFIIMQFGHTIAHQKIVKTIKNTLAEYELTAVRADDKQYHNNLYENVLTYLHGCGFAIAIFERLEDDNFNPNVSLEVGYLLAMDKPVCLLKDNTLKRLPTDIVGFLYRQFDPQAPVKTIPPVLTKFMLDKEIIREDEEKLRS